MGIFPPDYTAEQIARMKRGYRRKKRTCVMCGRAVFRWRSHVNTCSTRCRVRFHRWQKGQGPGPEKFGGLQAERD